MAFHQSIAMPLTPDAASRLISMEVKEASLFYYKHHSPNLERLPSLSRSEFEYVGDVGPIIFDRDAISFTQTDYWSSAVVRLATGDSNIPVFSSGNLIK